MNKLPKIISDDLFFIITLLSQFKLNFSSFLDSSNMVSSTVGDEYVSFEAKVSLSKDSKVYIRKDDLPINPRNDIGLSDQDLVTMGVKDLNRCLKRKNISKERQSQIKEERRTLKNRGYAAGSREKKDAECKHLMKINEKLKSDIYREQKMLEKARFEMEQLLAKYREQEVELEYLREEFRKCKETEETGLKNLLQNRSEIQWEKVREDEQV